VPAFNWADVMVRVLVVDDEPMQLRIAAAAVTQAGFVPVTSVSGVAALQALRADPSIAAILLDLVMPDIDGMAVMEAINREALGIPVIVQTTTISPELVVTIMRHGAADFVVKPATTERLAIALRNALKLRTLEATIRGADSASEGTLSLGDVVGLGERVRTVVQKAAKSPLPVLIEGETGTGKHLVAKVIAGSSERAGKPFVALNCGMTPLNHLEAALFGAFQEAQGGVLYLDEIGELPLDLQEKLLLAIETGKVTPVGATKPERVNVRVIAASNRRLMHVVKAGGFREDLYYRLHVTSIYMPPLRDRREEIADLVERFIARFAAKAGKPVSAVSHAAVQMLMCYDWPGNVGQLENATCQAVMLAQSAVLGPHDFAQIMAQLGRRDAALQAIMDEPVPAVPMHIDVAPARHRQAAEATPDPFLDADGKVTPMADLERALITFAIAHHEGRMSRVARALKIGRSTLYRKLREYGLDDQIAPENA
jgi:DNA-binding NtrC family response regulator